MGHELRHFLTVLVLISALAGYDSEMRYKRDHGLLKLMRKNDMKLNMKLSLQRKMERLINYFSREKEQKSKYISNSKNGLDGGYIESNTDQENNNAKRTGSYRINHVKNNNNDPKFRPVGELEKVGNVDFTNNDRHSLLIKKSLEFRPTRKVKFLLEQRKRYQNQYYQMKENLFHGTLEKAHKTDHNKQYNYNVIKDHKHRRRRSLFSSLFGRTGGRKSFSFRFRLDRRTTSIKTPSTTSPTSTIVMTANPEAISNATEANSQIVKQFTSSSIAPEVVSEIQQATNDQNQKDATTVQPSEQTTLRQETSTIAMPNTTPKPKDIVTVLSDIDNNDEVDPLDQKIFIAVRPPTHTPPKGAGEIIPPRGRVLPNVRERVLPRIGGVLPRISGRKRIPKPDIIDGTGSGESEASGESGDGSGDDGSDDKDIRATNTKSSTKNRSHKVQTQNLSKPIVVGFLCSLCCRYQRIGGGPSVCPAIVQRCGPCPE